MYGMVGSWSHPLVLQKWLCSVDQITAPGYSLLAPSHITAIERAGDSGWNEHDTKKI